MRRHKLLLIMLLGCLCLATVVTRAKPAHEASSVRLQPSGNEIPSALFGMHIHRFATSTPWPEISFGSIRLWDAHLAWPYLEPQKGTWQFAPLDKYVTAVSQNKVDILLPLGLSPAWASSRPDEKSGYSPGNAAQPANLDDWREYVRAVGTRYKGRIHEYEIWNEPNLKQFYSGSIPQMVELARIAYTTLKEIDPTVIVCSPSATAGDGVRWLDQYLQEGGGKYADVIGYHFYVTPQPPEKMVPIFQLVEAVMEKNGIHKPLWDTETGWAIQNSRNAVVLSGGTSFNTIVLSTEDASAYLARAYLLSWAGGVSRLYWYSWDSPVMGLTEEDGKTAKPPARAYAEVEKWLIGARMTSCQSDEVGTWTCEITREHGYRGWILWNPNHTVDFHIPNDWRIRNERSLLGDAVNSLKAQTLSIGQAPVLLENTSL